MPTRCFLIEPLDRAGWLLRRFAWAGPEHDRPPCVGGSVAHDASSAILGYTTRLRRDDEGRPFVGWPLRPIVRSDPRWPTLCSRPGCGYEFAVGDDWQRRAELLWARADTGEEFPLGDAPTGAMFDAWWQPDGWRGPDGLHLNVRLPCGHDWPVDGPASSGGRWERTGEVPAVSVTPSIACGAAPPYHGFLGSSGQPPGWLSDHIG